MCMFFPVRYGESDVNEKLVASAGKSPVTLKTCLFYSP